jgi:hypothetical protein
MVEAMPTVFYICEFVHLVAPLKDHLSVELMERSVGTIGSFDL